MRLYIRSVSAIHHFDSSLPQIVRTTFPSPGLNSSKERVRDVLSKAVPTRTENSPHARSIPHTHRALWFDTRRFKDGWVEMQESSAGIMLRSSMISFVAFSFRQGLSLLGKQANQSSLIADYHANLAVDGNPSTHLTAGRSCTHTGE